MPLRLRNKLTSEMQGRADMLCPALLVRFVPQADILPCKQRSEMRCRAAGVVVEAASRFVESLLAYLALDLGPDPTRT
jgi:hypothetical protein